YAGRQGIERARMAALLGREQPAHLAHGLGGRDVIGLVEHEPSGDVALFPLGLAHASSLSGSRRSWRTLSERRSASMRPYSSKVSSTRKRNSGAYFRSSLGTTILRMKRA